MLAVHGVWADGALWLWAEDTDRAADRRAADPGAADPGAASWGKVGTRGASAPAPPVVPAHPFCATPEILAAVLHDAGVPVASGIADGLTLWLPTTTAGPQASPELAWDAGADRAVLSAWRVAALRFTSDASLRALEIAGEPGSLGPVAMPGGSLLFLSAVAAHAVDLARRGRVLPALARESDAFAARWWPVLTGADAQRAGELAAAVPAACRATTMRGTAAAGLCAAALDALTDAAVRALLAGGGLRLLPYGSEPAAAAPVAARWLAALTAADPIVTMADQEITDAERLAADLASWRAAAVRPAGPVRTCFRLVEPEPSADPEPAADPEPTAGLPREAAPDRDDTWTVEFLLQSAEDPSLMLTAAEVWAGEGGGWVRHPQEQLLAGLGAAARLFPEIEQELRTARPTVLPFDTAGAFGFLSETAPLLAGAGFGVLLPAWARRRRLGIRLTTRTRRTVAGTTPPRLRLDDLVDFRYELAIGDDVLDPGELEELARLKLPLVRVRGQWVELDQRNLQAALNFMKRPGSGTMRAGDALAVGLGTDGDQVELPVTSVDGDGWLADLLSGEADRRLEPVGTPSGFTGELRPYQQRGLAWLAFLSRLGLGGILADDMGLGKTIAILALLALEQEPARDGAAGSEAYSGGPTLLVCPTSVVGNWQKEAARFTPSLRVRVHHGADRLAGEELAADLEDADLVLTSYGVAARDVKALRAIGWRRVVCDEAQNIKNSATRQAQAVRSLPAGSRIALTGTPVENRLADLWSIMEFTSSGLLGPAERFRKRFAIPIERQADTDAIQRLKRVTGPFILRRLKTDATIISDLPEKLEIKVWCNLTAEQASLYQATVTDMMAKIEASEGIERRGLVLATMAKLKQVCNHPAHLLGDGSRLAGRSGKLARLEEICDEIVADSDKVLCFTQYAEFGRMLVPHLAARLGCDVLFLHGGTPRKQRESQILSFQTGTEPCVFILSLKAGGAGLNLTAANHVIHVDRWWNPAVEDQATDRAFRIGQRRDVQVRKFVCAGTVEERIDAMIEEKKALAQRIVGVGESWLTELSTDELRKVIELSAEAVAE